MLTHDKIKNSTVSTKYGKVEFDQNGFSNDLTEEEQKELGKLYNFNFFSDSELNGGDSKEESVEEEPKEEEPKSEPKEDKEEDEELPEAEPVDSNEDIEVTEALEEAKTLDEQEEPVVLEADVPEYTEITKSEIVDKLKEAKDVDFNESDTKKELYPVLEQAVRDGKVSF